MIVFCVLCLVAPRVSAQSNSRVQQSASRISNLESPVRDVGPEGTGVDELVQSALARNAELLAARQRIVEAQGLLHQAGLRPNPGVEVSVTNGSILGSAGEREFSVGYAHTFELGRKRERRVEVAELGLELARLEVADRERQLRAETKGRFGEALAAARNLETAGRLLELNQQGYRLAQARVREGEAAPLEQGLLQVEVSRLESDRLLFESQAARAILDLKTLAGMSLDEPLQPSGELNTSPVALSLAEATERALAERPDVKAARLEEKLGEAELQLANSEITPDLIGFARYTRTNSRFDQFGLNATGALAALRDTDNVLSAGVTITLPTRHRNQGSIQAATARRTAADFRRQFIEQVVRREVRSAYSRYEAARRALEIFDQRVIGQAQDNLRVIRAAYELGELRLLDVLNEQRRLIDAERAYTEVLKEYYLAVVELERAVGGPMK
jgi:cobalt-zinc-cadmium efflux system outer membrane protein